MKVWREQIKGNPFKVTRGEVPTHISGEQYLFQCCVGLIIQDAMGIVPTSEPRERENLVTVARAWLCFGTDFDEVCSLAGFPSDKLR
nr:hypothetical protein [uncultured Ruegeria sp.]